MRVSACSTLCAGYPRIEIRLATLEGIRLGPHRGRERTGRDVANVGATPGATEHTLRRAVGPWGSYTWGYADVGADIYVALGLVIATAAGVANFAFLFAGLVYVTVGLAYTELSAMYPISG